MAHNKEVFDDAAIFGRGSLQILKIHHWTSSLHSPNFGPLHWQDLGKNFMALRLDQILDPLLKNTSVTLAVVR